MYWHFKGCTSALSPPRRTPCRRRQRRGELRRRTSRTQPPSTGSRTHMILLIIYRVFIKYYVFFEDFKILRILFFAVFPRCQCVYQAGRTPALQQHWQSSENSKILRKNTIINEHPVLRAWKAIRGSEGESLKNRDLKNK